MICLILSYAVEDDIVTIGSNEMLGFRPRSRSSENKLEAFQIAEQPPYVINGLCCAQAHM